MSVALGCRTITVTGDSVRGPVDSVRGPGDSVRGLALFWSLAFPRVSGVALRCILAKLLHCTLVEFLVIFAESLLLTDLYGLMVVLAQCCGLQRIGWCCGASPSCSALST